MTTVGCLRCGVWYDPGKPHLCGVLGDDTARRLAERIDAFERRLQGLDGEARSRFNALERRVQELEAARRRAIAIGPTRRRPAASASFCPHQTRCMSRASMTSRGFHPSPLRSESATARRITPATCALGGCARRSVKAAFTRESGPRAHARKPPNALRSLRKLPGFRSEAQPLKKSGFEHPFQARQSRLGMAS
jgi:hypothetical protein